MVTSDLCGRIICGLVTQQEAGFATLYECAQNGFIGAKSCRDPACDPYRAELVDRYGPGCGESDTGEQTLPLVTPTPYMVPGSVAEPLHRDEVIAPMPTIVNKAKAITATSQEYAANLWCSINAWIAAHPVLAAGILFGVWYMGGKGMRAGAKRVRAYRAARRARRSGGAR